MTAVRKEEWIRVYYSFRLEKVCVVFPQVTSNRGVAKVAQE